MSKAWLIACMSLGLVACEADDPAQASSHLTSTEEDTLAATPPPAIAQPFAGIIIVGGRFCLGDTAALSLDQGLRALNQPLRNAAIKGEPLSGLLERLPYLLAQKPQSLVIEVGQEDEIAQTRLPAFKRSLRRLAHLLEGRQWVLLSTAHRSPFINAIAAFSVARDVPLVAINPRTTAPREAARRILPVLEI